MVQPEPAIHRTSGVNFYVRAVPVSRRLVSSPRVGGRRKIIHFNAPPDSAIDFMHDRRVENGLHRLKFHPRQPRTSSTKPYRQPSDISIGSHGPSVTLPSALLLISAMLRMRTDVLSTDKIIIPSLQLAFSNG